MALQKLPPASLSFSFKSTKIHNIPLFSFKSIHKCSSKNKSVNSTSTKLVSSELGNNSTITRRSANYQLPIWSFDKIQSLKTKYGSDSYVMRVDKLKEEVKVVLETVKSPLAQLELVDMLQRLGLSYHFESEIKLILKSIYSQFTANNNDNTWKEGNLYATALEFRLLRQHGYHVNQGVFDAFMDESGSFEASLVDGNIIGVLSLYEASFYSTENEDVLEKAMELSSKHLEEYIEKSKRESGENDYVDALVIHALELPLHWRMLRLESRWFIEVYQNMPNMSPLLLHLAKLDFNVVQSRHQQDLKRSSEWWTKSGIGEKLKFARDRLMENFLWTVGVQFEPQFGYFRTMSTRVNALITCIDDIYDVYGTLDELQLFTHFVTRWDMSGLDQLPEYMRACFLTLNAFVDETASDVLNKNFFHCTEYLRNGWADLCKSYLVEAKWFNSGYTPTLDEYIENAGVSISAPVILLHAYFLATDEITDDALKLLSENYNSEIIRQSAMILRLANDLGTSSDELKRGDVPKSVQCYMKEAGVSENEARKHVKFLINKSWKRMNKAVAQNSPFCERFIKVAMNLARMAQCMYEHGDGHGHGIQNHRIKARTMSLLINQVSLS